MLGLLRAEDVPIATVALCNETERRTGRRQPKRLLPFLHFSGGKSCSRQESPGPTKRILSYTPSVVRRMQEAPLTLLAERRGLEIHDQMLDEVANNREKDY